MTAIVGVISFMFTLLFADQNANRDNEFADLAKSYSHILQNETNPEVRLEIVLNRARTYTHWAKWLKANGQREKANRLALLARQGFNEALSNVKPKSRQHAEALYLLGVLDFEQGHFEETERLFRQALSSDAKAFFAPVALKFIGDSHFKRGEFEQAWTIYHRCLPGLKLLESVQVEQKLALIEINQKKHPAAFQRLERVMKKISAEPSIAGLRQEILNDLAILSAKTASEDQIVTFLKSAAYLSLTDKLFFVEKSINSPRDEMQGPLDSLYGYWLELEQRPASRIGILITAIEAHRSRRFHTKVFTYYEQLRQQIDSLGRRERAAILKAHGETIEESSQYLIVLLADTTNKRRPLPSSLNIEVADNHLQEQLDWHLTAFRATSKLDLFFKLAAEICIKKSNWSCVRERTREIIESSSDNELIEWSEAAGFVALENLYLKENSKYFNLLTASMERYLKNENASNWSSVALKLSSLWMEHGSHDQALALLQKVDERAASEESFYRLQRARWELKRYKDVVKDKNRPNHLMSPRVTGLIAESYLSLAKEIDTKERVDELNQNLEGYVALEQNSSKRRQAWLYYLSWLDKFELDQKIFAKLQVVDRKILTESMSTELLRRVVLRSIERGDLILAHRFLKLTSNLPVDLKQAAASFALALDPKSTLEKLGSTLEPAYVETLVALTQPQLLIRKYSKSKPTNLSEGNQVRLLWAHRINACDSEPRLSDSQKVLLKQVIKEESKPQALAVMTAYEKTSTKLSSGKLTDAQLAKSLGEIRDLRSRIPKALKALTIEDQSRLLISVVAVESKASQLIEQSVVPSNLSPTEAQDYKNELLQLSSDFKNQAGEMQQALTVVQGATLQEMEREQIPVPLKPNLERWPWPKSFALREPASEASSLTLLQELVRIDYLQAAKKISNDEYMAQRSGVLLRASKCSAMAHFVYNELKVREQSDVIAAWRKL